MKGIDVSVWQSSVDWQKVKNSGIDFVMLRGAYGESTDSKFQDHITGALAVGLNVGVYVYSIADTVEKAISEAKHVLELVKPYKLTYPIAFDLEDDKQLPLTVEQRTELCIAFCNTIEQAGYYTMIYANKYWLETKLNYEKLKCFDIWLAQWTSSPSWSGNYGIWQSGITLVDGAGNVDTDVSYKDYPAIIKGAGLNGWGKSQPTPAQAEPVVLASVAQPTSAPQNENYITYKVQSGDSFWQISQAKLGNGNRYMEIVNYNSMTAQTVIHPGDMLKIPCGQSHPAPQPIPQRIYTVKTGDSYWAIAQSQLGNGTRWTEIKALNGNKEVIHPGDVLKIPN